MKGIGAWKWPVNGKSMFNVLARFITKPFPPAMLLSLVGNYACRVQRYLYFQDRF